jgi:hypothetical protein
MEPPSISFGESHRPDLHLLPAEIAGFLCLLKRSHRLKEHRSGLNPAKLDRAVIYAMDSFGAMFENAGKTDF